MQYHSTPPDRMSDRVGIQAQTYNVFVYGTLKSGQSNHSLISPKENMSEFIGAAVTCSESYKIACNGGFPMVQDTRVTGKDHYKIVGEIYKINHKTLTRLDMLESNGRLYSRTQRPFTVNIGGEPTEIAAWIYLFLGNLSHYEDCNSTTLFRYQGPNKSKLVEWSR